MKSCLYFSLLSSVIFTGSAFAACTPSPDCASFGYTATSCPDGGVKCPFNTNLMFCPPSKAKDICNNCYVGWILNADMSCTYNVSADKTPIGVVISQTATQSGCQGAAIALSESADALTWSRAKSYCNNYRINGVTGWHFPTKDELLAIYPSYGRIQGALIQAGRTPLQDNHYWTGTSLNGSKEFYTTVNPSTGQSSYSSNDGDCISYGNGNFDYCHWLSRPVLSFEFTG